MKNETGKKRKIEKIKDVLEGKNHDVGRMVDRMDEFIDVAKTLNSTIENFKSVRVENLGDIQFPKKLEVSNLDSIPRDTVVQNFPEIQKAEILNFPEQKEVKFPDVQKVEIANWPEQKDVEEPSWFGSFFTGLLDSFLDKLAVLAKLMWRQTLTVRRDEDDRFKPQFVVLIDPETGKPTKIMSKGDYHTMVANGGGGGFETVWLKNVGGLKINPASEETLALLAQGNLWQRSAFGGSGYAVTTNNILIANTLENDFVLLKNPAGSGKTARVNKIVLGSDQNPANKSAFFRIYRDPAITSNGTSLAVNNLKKGGLASILTVFRIPVIASRGTLLSAGSFQASGLAHEVDLGLMILPGENLLITLNSTANNFDYILTTYLTEI